MAEYTCIGLFGKTRRSVLNLIYGQPDASFYTRQVLETVKRGRGAVQRELKNLTDAGIIIRKNRGRQIYYRANPECPIYQELRNIVKKTAVTPPIIRESGTTYGITRANKVEIVVSKRALANLCRRYHIVRLSFFGSVLRSDFRSDSDIDVLVEFAPDFLPGLLKFAEMEEELSRLFGRKVDLRTAGDLSRYIRQRVLNEAQVQYAATR